MVKLHGQCNAPGEVIGVNDVALTSETTARHTNSLHHIKEFRGEHASSPSQLERKRHEALCRSVKHIVVLILFRRFRPEQDRRGVTQHRPFDTMKLHPASVVVTSRRRKRP